MSHFANQIAQSITRVVIFALSILVVPFGLSSAPAFANQNLPDAPKTELVSSTSATRYHSYERAVADYHQSFLRSNCGKINFLALSRLESVASKRQYNLSISRFLEVRANQLSRERFQFYYNYSQENIPHS